MIERRLRIGISACFFHADPQRAIFKGKTLQYVEESLTHWVMASGALAYMIPNPTGQTQRGDTTLAHYADDLDGLVLEGGSDVWPGSYGEEPLRPEWAGDRVRDEYEIRLVRDFAARRKPVLGVCRGLQVLNVAFGGTLYQDIATQMPAAGEHRNWQIYDQNFHEVEFVPGTRLASLYHGMGVAKVNSVHHQAIKDLAPTLEVEAHSVPDGIIEAARWRGEGYIAGVQWHPEFHDPANESQLDGVPLLNDFLEAAHYVRGVSHA